jgi:hypothetical protein
MDWFDSPVMKPRKKSERVIQEEYHLNTSDGEEI